MAHLVEVMREVWRVLRDDGTLWLNMGDCYAAGGNGARDPARWPKQSRNAEGFRSVHAKAGSGLKPKDLVGIPWMVATALQAPYHTGPIDEKVDRAWLAGLIDADGSIGIRKQAPQEGRTRNPTFIPYLSVSCSDVVALERCRLITGLGSIKVKARAGDGDARGIVNTRDFYTWRLDGQIASRVIRDIYPFLVIKHVQAQIVYNMNLSLKWGRPTRSKPVPPEIVRQREQFYEVCKLANQRSEFNLPALKPVEPAEESGWYLRRDIIWFKLNPMPESATDRPTSAHEYLFLLTKNARYYYDQEAIREPGSGYPVKSKAPDGWDTGSGGHGTIHRNGREKGALAEIRTGRNRRTVWELATEPFGFEWCLNCSTLYKGRAYRRLVLVEWMEWHDEKEEWEQKKARLCSWCMEYDSWLSHFATFPTALVEPCIKAGSPEGGTVLDPFSGAGTTVLVAERLGRRGIGIELNPAYVAMAEHRLYQDAPMFAEVT